MLARRGWEEAAESGERDLIITLSKDDSFSTELCLSVFDSVTELYSG